MKWSVGTKIGAGFGLAIAIVITLGAVTYRTTSQLEETSNLESHSKEVLKSLEDLSGDATSIESAELGYMINPRLDVSAFLDHISNANLGNHNAGITSAGARLGVKF